MYPNGLQAENFNPILPALGSLVGAGAIDSRNNLGFKMAATLANSASFSSSSGAPVSGIGGIFGAIGVGKGGCKGRPIPFMIQATTTYPKYAPGIGGVADRR